MKSASYEKKKFYRIPPSKYWPQYWSTCFISTIATFQLLVTLAILGMEIGNALIDLYKANLYTGFWSFPFTFIATIAAYVSVCTKKSQTKAIVALIFQCIAVLVLLAVVGFLILFIVTDYQFCLGFQCSQNMTTFVSALDTNSFTFSLSTHILLKQVFILCELAFAIVFILFAILYLILFIKSLKKLPRIHPIKQLPSVQSSVSKRQMISSKSYLQPTLSSTRKQIVVQAQKICPNCKHISPYNSNETTLRCPKCGYRSNRVEHGQQWYVFQLFTKRKTKQ